MITGAVTAALEPIVPLSIRDSNGSWQPFDAVLDTGFSGELTLPADLVAVLGLGFLEQILGVLADGTQILFDIYEATIEWDGAPRYVRVGIAPGALVGTVLVADHRVEIDFKPGGRVTIQFAP